MSSPPRASGYFRTGYAQDFALVETRLRRVSLGIFALALRAEPCIPGFSQRDRRARPDAAHRLRRPDLARPCGPAGGRRLHGRHHVQGAQRAVLADAAVRGAGRRTARRRVRAAVAAPARALPRGQHAGAAFRRRLSGRRVRDAARFLDRHHHRSAEPLRPRAQRRPALVPRAACVRGGDAARLRQPDAQPHRPLLERAAQP